MEFGNRRLNVFKHILMWLLIIIYCYNFNSIDSNDTDELIFAFFFPLSFIITYYFIITVVKRQILYEKFILGTILYISSFLIFLILELINFKLLFPIFQISTPRDNIDFIDFMRYSTKWYCYILVVSYANIISNYSRKKIKDTNKKAEIRLNRELGILKSQFHSHLNFNFLNYCYSKLLKISAEKSEVINHYSDMLYYTLNYYTTKKNPISKEIEYIQNYIALQSKLGNAIYHRFESELDRNDYEITPLLLGLLLDLAYYAGDTNDSNHPIKVKLIAQNNIINYRINYKNAFVRESNTKWEKIFQNLHHFLIQNYGQNCKLTSEVLMQNFTQLQLTIILNEKS